jgi:Dienelactone hydrolase and related enzymes
MSGEWAKPAIILLHEIYGVNSHMRAAAAALAAQGFAVCCPDLLGTVYGYEQMAAAYTHYMRVGFNAACDQVTELARDLAERHKRIYLVGYSAGATVAWRCSASNLFAGTVGYYGSRIRDFLAVAPACPVLLLFPRQEESFSVAALTGALAAKDRVRVHVLGGRHGFADCYSPHFDAAAAAGADRLAAAFLQKLVHSGAPSAGAV